MTYRTPQFVLSLLLVSILCPELLAEDSKTATFPETAFGKSIALEERPSEEWKPLFGNSNKFGNNNKSNRIVETIVPRFYRKQRKQEEARNDSDIPAIAESPIFDDGQIRLLDDPIADIEFVRRLNIPNPLSLLGNPANWHGYLTGEWGSNFDDLSKIRTNIIVYSGPAFAFDSEANRWFDGKKPLRERDDFYSGDFNLVYRFGKMRNIQFRTGGGVNWRADDGDFDLGLNSTIGFDMFMVKPWVFSTSFDWGKIGSDTLLHMRFLVGWDLQKIDFFVGYDFYEIDDRERKGLVFGAGLQF